MSSSPDPCERQPLSDDNENNNNNDNEQSVEEGMPMSHSATTTPTEAVLIRPWVMYDSWYDYVRQSSDFREILLCLVFLLLSLLIYLVDPLPHQRPIPTQYLKSTNQYILNLVYNETYQGETVPDTYLIIFTTLVPCLLQLGLCKLSVCGNTPIVGQAHATVCVYFVALGLTLFLTEVLKLYVGYLRPIFYHQCQPNDTFDTCTSTSYTDSLRKSFPSGHASTSFGGLTLLTLYLHQRFGIPSVRIPTSTMMMFHLQRVDPSYPTPPHYEDRRVWYRQTRLPLGVYRLLSVLSLLPMGIALWIATSRIVDNKHFPADVVGGAVLGTSISLFCNSLWF